MSLLDTTQQALESAMSGSMLRQTLLTNNLANVDTPGYQPEDVNFQSTLPSAIQSGQSLGSVTYQPYSGAVRRRRRQRRQPRAAAGRAVVQRAAVRDAHPGRGAARVDPRERDGDGSELMSFFDAISIAASGLTAERMRMDVTSENLANADTTQGANGQPYQRQEVVLQQAGRRLRRRARRRDRPERPPRAPPRSTAAPPAACGAGHRQRSHARPVGLRPR